jgi:alkylation response protein AidB-like acyl-CoA dehydrogenase
MPEHLPPIASQSLLEPHDAQLIHEHAAQSDEDAALAPALQALVHERGWLRMLAPTSSGGAELALPDVVRLEESIAAADGSVGWLVTLCAGAGWFAGFLPPAFAREIIGTPNLCVAGSGARTGFADVEAGGYRLSGSWDFATGAPLATHFTLNAVIRENGEPLRDSGGAPRIRAFIIPARHVQVHDSWRSIGLRATASHSFSVDSVWVGAEHGFDIDAAHATAPGPLYRFPFVSLAYATLAANLSGMALNFVERSAQMLARRRHPATAQPLAEVPAVANALREAQDGLAAARSVFYRHVDRMWETVCRNAEVDPADMQALQAAALELVKVARRAVDELYPFCGLYAAHEGSDIGRAWRDLHTATQHTMLLPLPVV